MVAWDENARQLVMVGDDTLGFREFAARNDHWLPDDGEEGADEPALRRRAIASDSDLWRVLDVFCEARGLMFQWRFLQIVSDEEVLARAASE